MSLAMTKDEREAFLAGVHVGVIGIAEEGRAPLMVPIWYGYEAGGDVWIITERGSRKGHALEVAGRFSLCAQDENPPYKYVSVEGPIVTSAPCDQERHRRVLAHRYLGSELGDMYLESTAEESIDLVVYRMQPETWYTVDYGKQLEPGSG